MREANRATSIAALSDRFHKRFRIWFVLGIGAFSAVVTIYFLMVAKPLPIGGT
jgi:uncharacterized membrane protein